MTEGGTIRWNNLQGQGQEGVTATVTLNVLKDGSIHMETPESQGGYQGNFKSPQEAAQKFANLLEEGIHNASGTAR